MRYDVRTLKERGSFTVEAALITPLVLGVIVLFIYIALYAYDRCAMEYVCQMACSQAVYSGDGAETAVSEYMDQNLYGKLAGNWDAAVTVLEDDETVTVRVEATTQLFSRTFVHTATANKHFCPKY